MDEEYSERDIPLFDGEGKLIKAYIDFKTLQKQITYYSIAQVLALHRWGAKEPLGDLHPYMRAIEEEIIQRIGTAGKVEIIRDGELEVELHDQRDDQGGAGLHETGDLYRLP